MRLQFNELDCLRKERVDLYPFYYNILKAIFSTKSAFDGIYTYCKTGFPAFIVLSLCFVFHPPLHSQEIPVRQTTNESNSDSSVNNNGNTMMIYNSSSQNTATDKKLYYFSLKNNLLYDAVLLPNLTFEVYLGAQLSLEINGNWSWWKFGEQVEKQWFHRIQTVGAELRYWINSPYPLHGHAIGLYGMTGNYDLRLFPKNENSKGWLSNNSWSTGLSYAYSMPVSCYFNIEFGISIGYVGGKYYQYNYCIEDNWWAQQTYKNRHYFGPTKAGVSLVWLIGSGNSRKQRDVYFK